MGSEQNNRELIPAPISITERIKFFLWYEVLLFSWISAITLWHEFFSSVKKIDYNELPKRTGQTVVMTGGNRGIGYEVLKKLLQMDYEVIFGVRNVETGLQALKEIRHSGVETGSAKCFPLDLMSLKSVRTFAETVLKESSRIDLLINNAGIMFEPYRLTEDGYETHFQVNHLSHFLLTQLLLPKLKTTALNKSTKCRVVNVSSVVYMVSTAETLKSLTNRRIYSSLFAYFDSKMCQVLFTKYQDAQLNRENANINVYAVHPGVISTGLWVNIPIPTFIRNWTKRLFRSANTGADVIMYAAISPDLETNGGHYIADNKIQNTTKVANDLTIQKHVMDLSYNCVKGK